MYSENEIRDIFAQCVEACKQYNDFESVASDSKLMPDDGDITPRNIVQPSKDELWSRMVCLRNMIMRYIKGMPWKVIYRALKKTKGYVLTQHRQALDKVARCGK